VDAPSGFLATSIAAIQVHVSDPQRLADLLGFLRRAELRALQVAPSVVEIDLPHTFDDRQAELEVDLMLRVWRVLQPGVEVRRLAPARASTARPRSGCDERELLEDPA
jgi:hypothetical protein